MMVALEGHGELLQRVWEFLLAGRRGPFTGLGWEKGRMALTPSGADL